MRFVAKREFSGGRRYRAAETAKGPVAQLEQRHFSLPAATSSQDHPCAAGYRCLTDVTVIPAKLDPETAKAGNFMSWRYRLNPS